MVATFRMWEAEFPGVSNNPLFVPASFSGDVHLPQKPSSEFFHSEACVWTGQMATLHEKLIFRQTAGKMPMNPNTSFAAAEGRVDAYIQLKDVFFDVAPVHPERQKLLRSDQIFSFRGDGGLRGPQSLKVVVYGSHLVPAPHRVVASTLHFNRPFWIPCGKFADSACLQAHNAEIDMLAQDVCSLHMPKMYVVQETSLGFIHCNIYSRCGKVSSLHFHLCTRNGKCQLRF